MFTRTEDLVTRYGLPEQVAREIIADQTQKALRTSWQVWLWVVVAVAPALWLFFQTQTGHRFGVFWLLLAAVIGWFMIGSYLAASSIRIAAQEKAERIVARRSN